MITSSSVGIAVPPNFTPLDFGNSGAPSVQVCQGQEKIKKNF